MYCVLVNAALMLASIMTICDPFLWKVKAKCTNIDHYLLPDLRLVL